MKKTYDKNSVLIKLIYYCNKKREVYFKRSDVTEYLVNSKVFEIPNKQGFDGNLSYFGYDIQNDVDKQRILLLRGNSLNKQCLMGALKFTIRDENVDVISDDQEVFAEIDYLISNKTFEASLFKIKDTVNMKYGFKQCSYSLYRNKKIHVKDGIHYYYPRMLYDQSLKKIVYQTVSYDILSRYSPEIVFPEFDSNRRYAKELILSSSIIFHKYRNNLIGKDFYYFIEKNGDIEPVDIQDSSNVGLFSLINEYQYDLSDKETTKKVLVNARLNSGTLRTLALQRDNNKCLLCSINDTRLLVCSHIMPWRTGEARLDLNNVLTLCNLHDALFDKGFITVDDSGNVLYSKESVMNSKSILAFKEITHSRISAKNYDMMSKYLKYHRENVFLE
jgi:hypothetical protein